MSYCLNPSCPSPPNPLTANYCQSCGTPLVLVSQNKQTYRGLKCLGQGGFGRTFLAEDSEHQPYVIKQLFPGGVDAYRFQQEAERLEELGHHPQIPRLIDQIVPPPDAPDSPYYLIQEYIAGETLEAELERQGPMTESGGRSLLLDLLPVLEFIHSQRVIHRDIKPQNIIRPKGGGPLVLVDFGAAKRTSRTMMARTGTVIGSAGYAAPEQAMGKAVFASDLYSLGVTCVHALTGMHPFDLYSISQDQWVWSQYQLQPVSQPFATLLNTLLQRAVNQRYRTASAVLTDLKAMAPPEGDPTSSQVPLSSQGTPQRWPSLPVGKSRAKQQSSSNSPPNSIIQRLGRLAKDYASQAIPNNITTPRSLSSKSPTVPSPQSPQWLAFNRTPRPPSQGTGPTVPQRPQETAKSIGLPTRGGKHSGHLGPPAPLHWDLTHTLTQSKDSITALAISPDSSTFASGDRQGNILLWNLVSGTLLHTFPAATLLQRMGQRGPKKGHGDRITALTFTPDGSHLFSSSADGTIKQWQVAQRQCVATLPGEGWVISSLLLHPDGQLLISGGANGSIDLWNVTTHQFIQRLWTHTDRISGLGLATDGYTLFSGAEDGKICSWDLRTAEAIASISAHHNGVSALAIHPEIHLLITGGGDDALRLWHIASSELQLRKTLAIAAVGMMARRNSARAIAIHPHGTLLAHRTDDTAIQLWSLTSPSSPLTDPSFSDSRLSISANENVNLSQSAQQPSPSELLRPRRLLQLNQDWSVSALCFSPNGRRFVSSSTDGTIKLWQGR